MRYVMFVVALVVSVGVALVLRTGFRDRAGVKRAAFFISLSLTGLVAGLFMGTDLGQLQVQETLDAHQFAFFKQRFQTCGAYLTPAGFTALLASALWDRP